MKKWLDTFIKEKDLPMEEVFSIDKNGTCNIMSYKTISEHILITGENEQQKIKEMIIKIDFLNGDVLKYFRHLGNAIARSAPCF